MVLTDSTTCDPNEPVEAGGDQNIGGEFNGIFAKKLEEIFDLAISELRKIFKENKPITDKAKLAVQAMGVYSRLKSQENNARSLQYRIVRDFTADKKELQEYIKLTQPEFKLLESKK